MRGAGGHSRGAGCCRVHAGETAAFSPFGECMRARRPHSPWFAGETATLKAVSAGDHTTANLMDNIMDGSNKAIWMYTAWLKE